MAKFKKILLVAFGATLNFLKFKVALNATYRICILGVVKKNVIQITLP